MNKAIYIFICLFFVFANKQILAETENPKLRWEYKYSNDGEILYYRQVVKSKIDKDALDKIIEHLRTKDQERAINFSGEREAEGVFILKIKGSNGVKKGWEIEADIYQEKARDSSETEERLTIDKEQWLYMGGNNYEPLVIKNDGSVEESLHPDHSYFLLGQPQFVESGLDLWSKMINMYGGVMGHYRRLGEEEIKNKRCIVIETEIGQVEDGTDEEKGIMRKEGNEIWRRVKIKAKTWFDPNAGKIIRMEMNKRRGMRAFNDKGEMEYKMEAMEHEITYELLNASEIKKLDGIEDEWELVLPGVNNFQLTADGKIVYVREEVTSRGEVSSPEEESRAASDERRATSFIYICDGDGSNQRRLCEGTNPVVSPDGKWVAFKRGEGLWVVNIDEGNAKKIRDEGRINQEEWSHNGKFMFIRGKSVNGVYSIEDGQFKEIEIKEMADTISWANFNGSFIFYTLKEAPEEKKRFYSFERDKYYNYFVDSGETTELPFLREINPHTFVWSSKTPILAIKNSEGNILLYLSEKYKLLEKTNINDAVEKDLLVFWDKNGRDLICLTYKKVEETKTKIYVYDSIKKKIVWESNYYNFYRYNFLGMPNFEYIYFSKEGNLTKSRANYRVALPKDLREKISNRD
ncbi:MAG: hypothetical protein ABIH71_00450 [Candidatus Omnitrophota bacterium]